MRCVESITAPHSQARRPSTMSAIVGFVAEGRKATTTRDGDSKKMNRPLVKAGPRLGHNARQRSEKEGELILCDERQSLSMEARSVYWSGFNVSTSSARREGAKSWEYTVVYPDGRSEVTLSVVQCPDGTSLNNAGDEITLLDSSNAERDRFS
jgi:fibrinogen alpha-like protein